MGRGVRQGAAVPDTLSRTREWAGLRDSNGPASVGVAGFSADSIPRGAPRFTTVRERSPRAVDRMTPRVTATAQSPAAAVTTSSTRQPAPSPAWSRARTGG